MCKHCTDSNNVGVTLGDDTLCLRRDIETIAVTITEPESINTGLAGQIDGWVDRVTKSPVTSVGI